MQVLILTSWYPNKNSVIGGVFVKEQVKALQRIGVNPIVFYPFDNTLEKGKFQCSEEDGIITYRANSDYMRNAKLSKVNSIHKTVKQLRKIIKLHKIDVINAHVCSEAGIIALAYNRLYKMPYVITEHRSNIKEFANKSYYDFLFKAAYGRAQKVIPVSKALNNELMSLGYNFKGEIISNTVDTEKYELKDRNQKDNEYKILFVGSMAEKDIKGLRYFLPALSSFIKKNPHYKIEAIFVGEGVKREYFMQFVKELGIESCCKFTGIVEKEQIPEFMSNCDFLVLPSTKETFGAVLIEAMSCGKPVLCTKCGGPEEIVTEEVGILVESASIDALEVGLDTIINNYSRFNTVDIKEYAESNYSYEVIGKKIAKVLQEAIKK